ncbi:MAG: DUF5685 family protein [Candidatus Ornithomonoglobus sp.]
MFGYVTVAKNQLTEEEYNTFTAYYCGLCKATGKHASQLSRLGLSYDITFLAIVLSAVSSDSSGSRCERCIAHPFRKRDCIKNDPAVSYAAAMGVLLDYLKLADDWHDDRSIKALLAMAALLPGYLRIKKRYMPQLELIKKQLGILGELERKRCASVDETADAFAKILEALFTPEFIDNEGDRRALAWFGYNLGRWIYIIDAFNDLERDLKSGSYNPFIESGFGDKASCAADIELSLTFTLENIASAFELTGFKQNKTIVGKMVYTTLRHKQKMILSGMEKDAKRGSLRRRKEAS